MLFEGPLQRGVPPPPGSPTPLAFFISRKARKETYIPNSYSSQQKLVFSLSPTLPEDYTGVMNRNGEKEEERPWKEYQSMWEHRWDHGFIPRGRVRKTKYDFIIDITGFSILIFAVIFLCGYPLSGLVSAVIGWLGIYIFVIWRRNTHQNIRET